MPKKQKPPIFQDFREEALEQGKKMVNQSVNQVAKVGTGIAQDTGNFFLDILGIRSTTPQEVKSAIGQQKEMELRNSGKFTELDIKKIRERYESPEERKLREIRELLSHYHQLQKGEEKKAVQKHEQRDREREQTFQREEQEKLERKKREEKKSVATPKGKERKSIFGKVKKRASQVETKASSGKQ